MYLRSDSNKMTATDGELTAPRTKPTRSPRLGRYDKLAAQILSAPDPSRVFVDISGAVEPQENGRVIDLFAGAGGMSLGFQDAGFRVISAVELVEVAAETHRLNFPHTEVFCGDIGEYEPPDQTSGPAVEVVIGGPPCQGFSVAGKRDPDDPRNRLFEEFVRVVRQVQPDYFVMENVPGILTMSGGRVKAAILEAFAEAGYPSVSIAILEAARYGVAQLRARAIFVGNRHGLPNPFPAPFLEPQQYVPIEEVISDLPEWDRVPEINHEWTNHSKAFEARISLVPPGGSLYETFADAYKRQYKGAPSMTIKENHGGTHIHPNLNRCISAREMARLQSFPDDFYFTGGMKKAMWQIGNAVPPALAQAVAHALAPFLEAVRSSSAPKYSRISLPGEAIFSAQPLF